MNIAEYFRLQFGRGMASDSQGAADAMPIDSPCGEECKAAIDAAKAFWLHSANAFGNDESLMQHSIIAHCENIVLCYICG